MKIEPMKAITLWQPWASLLACGAKMFETRGWVTKYRGPIAIHAGLSFDNCFEEQFGLAAHAALKAMLPGFTYMHELPRGYIIAVAELIDVWRVHVHKPGSSTSRIIKTYDEHFVTGEREITDTEFLFGDFSLGRYAWEFANMQMLDKPIPAKGKQGLWNWEGVA